MKNKNKETPHKNTLSSLKKLALAREETVISFRDLYAAESIKLKKPLAEKEQPKVNTGTSGEPWVAFTPQDRFGLALSGGGIRSATFNLGLLQSLDQLGVLPHLDYLATVSGGGYVGGFWTAWQQRKAAEADENKTTVVAAERFPRAKSGSSSESAEVRHLREFSRFLLPRICALGTEFWNILMTALGGLLPSLTTSLAVLVMLWLVWVLVLAGNASSPFFMWLAVSLSLFIPEVEWRKPRDGHHTSRRDKYFATHDLKDMSGYLVGGVFGTILIGSGWMFWQPNGHSLASAITANAGFLPAALFLGVALILLVIRVFLTRIVISFNHASFLLGFERAVTRILRLGGITLAWAALWFLAVEICGKFQNGHHTALAITGTGATLSTTLFLWASKWLSEPPKETNGGNLLRGILNSLKRATPKLLASLTWTLLFLLVGIGVAWWLNAFGTANNYTFWNDAGILWRLPLGCLLLIALMILFYDPKRMGMHELYRSRISRCYLGASNFKRAAGDNEATRAAMNRSTNEHPLDDLTLGDLEKVSSPIHLVCTAANDLAGDVVGTLYRGAKSAVLSVHGISVGNRTAKLDELPFSSALTASAAAFNSQMGRYSMDLGPAVTFLMTTFNLRLGLWVPHPTNVRRWKVSLPGRFFFYELFGFSKADGKNLLLSDGGHFENFGLYELIRRHCRYIIVSDCGADAEVAFDDLANVLRRVREDFGVEIELDITHLQPGANGQAKQHAVVGTIHYNGLGGLDKGTLIFIKPAITGDEPPDVLQYRTRNVTFPHESTANQFYDEPQWESYRRLGAHTGRVVFEFLDLPDNDATTVDHIFRKARSFWYALPEKLNEGFIEMSGRFSALGESLSANGPLQLRREFFPETKELTDPTNQNTLQTLGADDELAVLEFLLRVVQVMEDVWVSGEFERYWSHPLNEGWMNYFHRWANTPSFRRWWPVLGPIYSLGFRSFVQERFNVGSVDASTSKRNSSLTQVAQLKLHILTTQTDYQNSNAWRNFQARCPNTTIASADKKLFGYTLQLLDRNGALETKTLWVGFVLVTENTKNNDNQTSQWNAADLFVPPMLHGGKIQSNLLDSLITHYEKQSIHQLQVKFGSEPTGKNSAVLENNPNQPRKSQGLAAAARYVRVREIEFYKSRGFQYHEPEDITTGEIILGKILKGKSGV